MVHSKGLSCKFLKVTLIYISVRPGSYVEFLPCGIQLN